MNRLRGKVALVTGASRGIGRGIALELAREGADIAINYRTHLEEAQGAAEAIQALGRHAMTWQADVGDREAVRKMVDATVDHYGHLDIAVANAAFSIREPVIEAQWENVLRTIEVSQFGVFHTCQLAAQHMVAQHRQARSGGKIVIISSVMEEICFPESAAYQMAKGAINCLGRTMASELAPYHINVNVVNPGWIDTPGERRFYTEQELKERGKYIPWGRLGTPEDIARTVAFLVSDAADYVTGATLRVDGGFILGLRLGGEGGY
jgi:glucose 1-dehydrogenase